ncbi:unnamed protein product [Blepharisma stoltei]|uniref:Uncharacterized protein n=1 Tax=Blepharisma stoltei TaxID=1481888 RepID=A0AAU9K7A7_9CILI|nr:unnamed protein product [Blepharisma stoltei]
MNLIMYVDKKEGNQLLMDRALYINNRVYVRLRPVVEKGSIDPRYYKIKINLDYRLSAELAIIELGKKWRIWEAEIEADFGVGNGTIIAYVWFDSMEQIYALWEVP